jgi:ATP-dependent DNA helicase RecQ
MNSTEHLMQQAEAILKKTFGYSAFRSVQKDVVEAILSGDDAFVLMPTGGGKSICYQIPSIVRKGTGIIVSPLISLMKDQVDALVRCGVEAAYYNSSLKAAEAASVLHRLQAGKLDLLYVAPERLLSATFSRILHDINLALFAIDEAHCVSQWGHDFRPEYEKLGRLRDEFPGVPILALTATADEHTRKDILQCLHIEKAHQFISSFDRPNIRYLVAEKHKPMRQLLDFLDDWKGESGIIYCMSRKRVEEVAVHLQRHGIRAAAYHAGMPGRRRDQVQDDFLNDRIRVIVATIAFGMGVDKPNVRYVVHHDMPKSVESYYQETGRAGRDGMESEALLLYSSGDVNLVRRLIDNVESKEQKRIEIHKLNSMIAFSEALTCRRRVLLGYFGEKLSTPCGNCDICLDPPETYDAIKPARLAIRCIRELEENYSKGYVIDVLRGSTAARIIERGHDKLSTYGAGLDLTADEWTSILRQLMHQGYCTPDISHRSALKLTPEAAKLDTRKHLMLAHFHQGVNRGLKRPVVNRADPVFAELSDLRREMAEKEGVAPHVLMNDATLAEMSHKRPQSLADLSAIDGMGLKKVQTYGESFLHLLMQHGAAESSDAATGTATEKTQKQRISGPPPNDTQMFTWHLYKSGEDAASIAAQQGISDETVLKHFVALVRAGYDIDVHNLLGEVFDEVTAAVEAADEYASLTDIKRSMDTPVSNEAFRLVLAWREAAGIS